MKKAPLAVFVIMLAFITGFFSFPHLTYAQPAPPPPAAPPAQGQPGAPAMTSCTVTLGGGGVGAEGITYPPDLMENPEHPGYFLLPHASKTAPSGAYLSYTCVNKSHGHKDLIGVLHTVAERWKQKYPGGKLLYGDLNAVGHKSHNIGRAVDLQATTNGTDKVADMTKGNYNREATIELGKMYVDTNLILSIWYNDQAVNAAVLQYARDSGKSADLIMKPQPNHENHFHLNVNTPELPFWEPSC